MNGTILLVEDDVSAADLIKVYLKDIPNVELLAATTGGAAIDIVKKHDVDLLLLDINMPGMDGFTVLDLLRYYKFEDLDIEVPEGLRAFEREEFLDAAKKRKNDKLKNIPVVMMTGSQEKEDVTTAANYRVAGYLVKPIDKTQLLRKLRTLL